MSSINRNAWLLAIQSSPRNIHFAGLLKFFGQILVITSIWYHRNNACGLLGMDCCLMVIQRGASLADKLLIITLRRQWVRLTIRYTIIRKIRQRLFCGHGISDSWQWKCIFAFFQTYKYGSSTILRNTVVRCK